MIRTLLFLLSLCFATPAVAIPVCHDAAPAVAAHAMPGGAHRAAPEAQPQHACIGCIPPTDWLAPRVAARAIVPGVAPTSRVARLDLGASAPPALPPPRNG